MFSRPSHLLRRGDCVLLAILLLSLAIKLTFALNMDHLRPRNDEVQYLNIAMDLLHTGEYTSNFRPPAEPALIALTGRLGGNAETVRVIHTLLSTLTVLFAYLVARSIWTRPVAGWTAALVAAWLIVHRAEVGRPHRARPAPDPGRMDRDGDPAGPARGMDP